MSDRIKQMKRALAMSSTMPPGTGGGEMYMMGSAHTHSHDCGHNHAPGESCGHDHHHHHHHEHGEHCTHDHVHGPDCHHDDEDDATNPKGGC